MLRQYHSIQITDHFDFRQASELLETYTYNNFVIRFFSNSIDIIKYEEMQNHSTYSECCFQQKDLLHDLQRCGSTKQNLTILKVFTSDEHILLIIKADQSFYIGLIYLPELIVYDLRNIFSTISLVTDNEIVKLSRINVIASLMKIMPGNKTVESIDILGVESNSSQIYFYRLLMNQNITLYIEMLKELNYPQNYPKHNEQPIIKALFIKKTNKFLIFLHQKMYLCIVKEKHDKQLSIEHDQKKNMNVKILMQQILKKGSEASMLMDICATSRLWIFLIRTNSLNSVHSSEFCFTLLFVQSSFLQNLKVVRDLSIVFAADEYNKQQKCRLTILQQLTKNIVVGITCGKQWRILNYIQKDNNQFFGGHSAFPLQKTHRLVDRIAITSKQRMRLIPLKLLFISPNRSMPQTSQVGRNLSQKFNRPQLQNSRTGGPLLIQNSNQQILQQVQQPSGLKKADNNINFVNNRQQALTKNTNNSSLSNMRNNNRIFSQLNKIPESRQVNSEDEEEIQPDNTNNQAIPHDITHILGGIFQNQTYPLHSNNHQEPFNQISFGAEQIMYENQRQPLNVSPQNAQNNAFSFGPNQIYKQNNKQVVNPLNILANNMQNNNIFSFSAQQIADQNMPSTNERSASSNTTIKILSEDKSFKPKISCAPVIVAEQLILQSPIPRKRSKKEIQKIQRLLYKMENSGVNWQNQQSILLHKRKIFQNQLQNKTTTLFPKSRKVQKIIKEETYNSKIKENILSEESILNKFIQQLNIILPQQLWKNSYGDMLVQEYTKNQGLYYQKLQEARIKLFQNFKFFGLKEGSRIRKTLQALRKCNKAEQPKKPDMRQRIQQKLIQIKLKFANLSYEWQQFQLTSQNQIKSLKREDMVNKRKQWGHVINKNIKYYDRHVSYLQRQSEKQRKKERKIIVLPNDFKEIDPMPLLSLTSLS